MGYSLALLPVLFLVGCQKLLSSISFSLAPDRSLWLPVPSPSAFPPSPPPFEQFLPHSLRELPLRHLFQPQRNPSSNSHSRRLTTLFYIFTSSYITFCFCLIDPSEIDQHHDLKSYLQDNNGSETIDDFCNIDLKIESDWICSVHSGTSEADCGRNVKKIQDLSDSNEGSDEWSEDDIGSILERYPAPEESEESSVLKPTEMSEVESTQSLKKDIPYSSKKKGLLVSLDVT